MACFTRTGSREQKALQHPERRGREGHGRTRPGRLQQAREHLPQKSAGRNAPRHDIPLNRLYHDAKPRSDNRAEAIKACKAHWGTGYSRGGKLECDEYPFAATYKSACGQGRPGCMPPLTRGSRKRSSWCERSDGLGHFAGPDARPDQVEHFSGGVAFETADDLAPGLALRDAPLIVIAGARIEPEP